MAVKPCGVSCFRIKRGISGARERNLQFDGFRFHRSFRFADPERDPVQKRELRQKSFPACVGEAFEQEERRPGGVFPHTAFDRGVVDGIAEVVSPSSAGEISACRLAASLLTMIQR